MLLELSFEIIAILNGYFVIISLLFFIIQIYHTILIRQKNRFSNFRSELGRPSHKTTPNQIARDISEVN